VPGISRSSSAEVIADALRRARVDGTNQIGEEHLFAALLANPDSSQLVGRLGEPEQAAAVWAEVRQARRRGGLTVGEQQALAELGIDLDEVVAQVEARLGAGALDDTQASARRGWRVSMSPGAVAVMNAAQRQKTARGDRRTTARHLMLGLLAQPGLFTDALAARGITLASALAAMDEPTDEATDEATDQATGGDDGEAAAGR
jgi:ATP-dependent Clp protease ATP-binding subunit ClpA